MKLDHQNRVFRPTTWIIFQSTGENVGTNKLQLGGNGGVSESK